ncbi:hypothetical protein K439DRAFT_1612476 [Ramaria rubella]|nr:hypothetical protein K439DRAFT_1612476 [Ramaria rubella]
MNSSLAHISTVYASLLTPVPLLSWLGAPISILDVLAAIRLCAAMRQIREAVPQGHNVQPEEGSFLKNYGATLTVVYGGEAFTDRTAAWLRQTPSFIVSGAYPLLYLGAQFFIESFPWMPTFSFQLEGPLTFLDALTRSYLLTSLLPPSVLTHADPIIANSPWTLLLVTFITANGGFFIVNLVSMFNPGGWSLVTPAELKSYGWTTVDLWAAPLITAIVALLTQAQPVWAHLHIILVGLFHSRDSNDLLKAWTVEDARSFGAVILWALFAARAVKNYGIPWWNARPKKKEVMRSRIDGRRYLGPSKIKKMQ